MNSLSRCKPLLGTYVDISIAAPVSDDFLFHLTDLAFEEIGRIQSLMSFHDRNSELTKINKLAYLEPVAISADMENVVSHALFLSALTNGIYDISVAESLMHHGGLPSVYNDIEQGSSSDIALLNGHIKFAKNIKIDLGGIAKGYAVDQALDILMAQPVSYEQVCINAGGDLRFLNWQNETASIRHPSTKRRNCFLDVNMQAAALATSAPSYTNKNSLIIIPHNGSLLSSKDSISVFAPSCMIADAFTKILFINPQSETLLKQFGATALKINSKGTIIPFKHALLQQIKLPS